MDIINLDPTANSQGPCVVLASGRDSRKGRHQET